MSAIRALGIDLGATTMHVAQSGPDHPRTVDNPDEEGVIQALYFQGEPAVVGDTARSAARSDPQRLVKGAALLLGARYDDLRAGLAEWTRSGRLAPNVVRADDGGAEFETTGGRVHPETVMAALLAYGARPAGITDAVLAVPAGTAPAQAEALSNAARTAGLTVLDVIDDAWAAVLAAGLHQQPGPRTVAVLHVGGATAHASILHVADGKHSVLARAHDPQLGGIDFTNRIVQRALDVWASATGTKVAEQDLKGSARLRLREAAESVKHSLSVSPRATFDVSYFQGERDLVFEMSRTQLERLAGPEFDRLSGLWRTVLNDAALGKSVTDVLLIGGQSRMPRIHTLAREVFQLPADTALSPFTPDEAVGYGCAVHAAAVSVAARLSARSIRLEAGSNARPLAAVRVPGLTARLTTTDGAPVTGEPLTFTSAGGLDLGTATTDGDGRAHHTADLYLPLDPDTHAIDTSRLTGPYKVSCRGTLAYQGTETEGTITLD